MTGRRAELVPPAARDFSTAAATSASFRDPQGRTHVGRDQVLREVTAAGWQHLSRFLSSPLCRQLEQEGLVVSSNVVCETEHGTQLEHEKIFFPSYPYEWPAEMLHAAAALTVELARRCLPHGFGLKDASPYNVLFHGPKPVFVDVLSFEERNPRDPMWLPYAQFVRNFLLPLLLDCRATMPLKATFSTYRDGIDEECAYRMLGPVARFLFPALTLATIPALIGRVIRTNPSTYNMHLRDREKAQFALDRLYRAMQKHLTNCSRPRKRKSMWLAYEDETSPYAASESAQKREFVHSVLTRTRPPRVLDIGCNVGTFSRMASRLGSSVVAIDFDPAVVGALWQKARAENLDVLPLVVDVARPSPASGWKNLECESFLSRCKGRFDCVLVLGMLHHLLVTERIPVSAILDLAAELTSDTVIIEYIGPTDRMFRSLLRGRENLHEALTRQTFENACNEAFRIVEQIHLPVLDRVVYFLKKKSPA